MRIFFIAFIFMLVTVTNICADKWRMEEIKSALMITNLWYSSVCLYLIEKGFGMINIVDRSDVRHMYGSQEV